MNELLTQVGVGGILAILILREVFGFLKNKKNNPGTGVVSATDFREFQREVQYVSTCKQIVKRLDERFDTVCNKLDKLDDFLRNGNTE